MPIPIITLEQMRQWEQATWAAGKTPEEVIQQVGRIVADRARQMTQRGDRIVILAGKGHNGDDVRAASQSLSEREVCLINVTDPQASLAQFQAQLSPRPALLMDGLFGIGLNRPLEAGWVQFIEAVNASAIPVLAVDVPSGLNAETGEPLPSAIHASVTLTLGAAKIGLLKPSAWPFVGRLEVASDIGLVPLQQTNEMQWTVPEDFAGFPPTRPVQGHKGTFGHLGILAGSQGYHGAAVLAARGALRAQPGLVTLMTPENVYVPIASQLQAVMVHPWQSERWEKADFTAKLIGPGFANLALPESIKNEARHAWATAPHPVVTDASALDWLPPGRTHRDAIRLITPHPGEAARLLGTTTHRVQGDRPAALRELSHKFGNCWVVLKGHQTLVGRATGEIFVNSSGNPFLAQGGSGDLLGGYVAGLLAQSVLQTDPARTIRYAVWQHGASADLLTTRQKNWTLDDLAGTIGNAA